MKFKNKWYSRYMKPAGDNDGGGGSAADRGDDFVPTGPDDDDVIGAAERVADGAAAKVGKKDATPEGEKVGEKEGEPPAGDKKGKGAIPLERHTAVLEKERTRREALERELQRYQGSERVVQTNADIEKIEAQIVTMERDHAKLMTDGEHEKAAELMSKIRRSERSLIQQQSEGKIAEAEARAAERVRYDVAVERLESAYPALNPDHADFDDELMKEVVDLKNAYQLGGRTPTEAMQKAVKVLLGSETSRQAAATTVKPKVDEDDPELAAATAQELAAAARKTAAIERAVATAAKQPPTTTKAGLDSDKAGKGSGKEVAKMSYKEFSSLSEEDLSGLRGDLVD